MNPAPPSPLLSLAFVLVASLAIAMCLIILLTAIGLPLVGAAPGGPGLIIPTP